MILEIQQLNFSFSPEKTIFQKLSLRLQRGEIYALMGANGSGKTTLFNLITGFHQPQSGMIMFQGLDITQLPSYKINRKGVCRTFQDLRLVSKLNVKENVLLAMSANPTDNWLNALLPSSLFKKTLQQLEKRAEQIIVDYFLHDVQHAMAHEISFGQQKLLNLACSVANGAELLLLDEPVAGISSQYREQISYLVHGLKKQGKTVLMIEHNTDFIAATADRFLFLANGKLSEFANFEQLQTSPEAADAYF